MTTKKTLSVPEATDGVPVVVQARQLDKTRELPARAASRHDEAGERERDEEGPRVQAAPHEIVDDDLTVPVQSSIESTLTFEVLRRQSTEEDEDERKR
jgi:hypothetical protein